MTICDMCKKNVPTKVYTFCKLFTELRNIPQWDLCDECEKKIFNGIKKNIGEVK